MNNSDIVLKKINFINGVLNYHKVSSLNYLSQFEAKKQPNSKDEGKTVKNIYEFGSESEY